jgi:hypothetical protein
MTRTGKPLLLLLPIVAALATPSAHAQQGAHTVTVKNHKFQPAEITVKANAPISLRVRNQDSSRMEFESSKPNIEKVIGGKSEATIKLQPLAPGRYEFYDDFNQQSTFVLIAR